MSHYATILELEKEYPGYKVQLLRTVIPVKAGKALFYFPANDVIQDKPILALNIPTIDEVAVDAASGFNNISNAVFKNGTIVLKTPTNEQVVQNIGLYEFNRSINNGVLQRLNAQNLAWQQCYLQFPNSTGISNDECVILEFWYLIEDKDVKLAKASRN